MAQVNCSSCSDLQDVAPNLAVTGFTDDMCTSLQNGTGLNPSAGSDNCTDLNNLNDCLIGNQEAELNMYETCDWKKFMKQFIPNLWTTLKAVICAICGVWEFIKNLNCIVNYLVQGASFKFSEVSTEQDSRVVPGKGVEFDMVGSGENESDIQLVYVGGALAYITGSVQAFVDSYKNSSEETQPGNSVWDFEANDYTLPYGGELLYEIRMKKSEYPMIKRFFRGDGWNNAGGQNFYQTAFFAFDGDSIPEGQDARYAYGQHGSCNVDGSPHASGYSEGHAVHTGYFYIQCRMLYVGRMGVGTIRDGSGAQIRGSQFTPHGYMGVRLNQDGIEC